MEKDNLHEAEEHLMSSGLNPDHHVYQAILMIIWEVRRLRLELQLGKKGKQSESGA